MTIGILECYDDGRDTQVVYDALCSRRILPRAIREAALFGIGELFHWDRQRQQSSPMNLADIGIKELGERVRALHGEEVFQAALQRALAVATRNAVRVGADSRNVFPDAPAGVDLPPVALSNDAVVAALRAEFLKLLRPN